MNTRISTGLTRTILIVFRAARRPEFHILFGQMNDLPASITVAAPAARAMRSPVRPRIACKGAYAVLVLAAAALPISLLWDFSWESTVGIDRVWAPAHAATYLAVAAAGLAGLAFVFSTDGASGVQLGSMAAPLGAWLALWGALVFPVAFLFDSWWQSSYGLAAGIWHPPQILKAVAFFSIVTGAWLLCARVQNQTARGGAAAFAASGGFVMVMISVVTVTGIYPNRQHTGTFYEVACAVYPLLLVAVASAGRVRWLATLASAVYMALICSLVWLLPLFPAHPQVPPIYNPLDHMLPPPFPLLLILPAFALDALLRKVNWPSNRSQPWLQAIALGVVFFIVFAAVQWAFAEFLLTSLADNWFFAGGGRHWPFFLKIDPLARVQFWNTAQTELNLSSGLASVGLAVVASRCGLLIGDWMKRLQR